MKQLNAIKNILGLAVTLPIWYYLIYKLLEAAPATELMWFLFWVYVPAGLLVNILTKIAEAK